MAKIKINKYSIVTYSLNDLDIIKANCKKTKDGFPLFWPTKNEIGQRMVFSFVDARIYGSNGELKDEEVANFNLHFSLDSASSKPGEKTE